MHSSIIHFKIFPKVSFNIVSCFYGSNTGASQRCMNREQDAQANTFIFHKVFGTQPQKRILEVTFIISPGRKAIYKNDHYMQVICLEDAALYSLVEQVVARLKETNSKERDKWIPPEIAMEKLNITSKSTLQSLRDNGKIRYSQPQKKVILYDYDSILEYLEKNAKNTF